MINQNTYCVIMAGGIGTRFWPMSTSDFPKQFHDVLGTGKSLIQQTYHRLLKLTDKEKIFVITDASYTHLVKEQLPEMGQEQIIAEPTGMNTAACAIYAALKIYKVNPEANIVLCPSDHLVIHEQAFADSVSVALKSIDKLNGLYTLGIEPTRPDTGYGYIQYLESDTAVKKVKTFTEKPSRDIAENFLLSGDFLWNSGVFIWRAETILEAFKKYLPEMYQSMSKAVPYINTEDEFKYISEIYPQLQKISIDVGIMEKYQNVYVIPANFDWSDLGTWTSLYENQERDKNRNAVVGNLVKLYNAKGNIVHVTGSKAVVIEGLDNYIVVDTENSLLICPLSCDQEVKRYVSDLKLSKGEKFV